MNSPSDLLISLRDSKEKDKEYFKRLDLFHEIANIATVVVYHSALHGNVRCKEAVREIEKKLKLI